MPQERDLPEGTAEDTSALSTYDEQVEGLADLLDDDPETDPAEDKGTDAADVDPDDPDAIIAEDATEETEDVPDGSTEQYKGGQFVPDTGKVTLDDGSTITVAELKRNNLYQRDYTKKTTELSAEREQITARRQEVDQQAQSLSQLSEAYIWYAENYLPKAPTPPTDPQDYVGFIQYQRAKDAFDQSQNALAYFQQQTQAIGQQKQREAEVERNKRVRTEVESLAAKDPLFRDRTKANAWFGRAAELGGEYYGFNPQEIAGAVQDHRLVLALRDAFRYRALKAKAPAVREEVGKKPVIATGGKRTDPKATANKERQAKSERLRRDGTFEAGVAVLEGFDL